MDPVELEFQRNLDSHPRNPAPNSILAKVSVQGNAISAGRDAIFNVVSPEQPQRNLLEDMRRLARWLSPLNYHQIHKDILEKVLDGTASWILEHPMFVDWITKKIEILWGWGIPGAGKSCLTAYVIDHLITHEDATVIYAYCQYKDRLSTTAILACLLKQMVERSEDVTQYVSTTLYENCLRTDTKPSKSELLVTLRGSAQRLAKMYLVVDALDEVSEEVRLELVSDLASLHQPLFVTSRPLPALSLVKESFMIRAPENDIHVYVSHKIASTPNVDSLLRAPGVREEFIGKILKKCEGMFLLASLQIDALASGSIINIRTLREAVAKLPTSLDEQYRLTLQRIQDQSMNAQELAIRAILFITYATRTLRVDELLDALTVDEKEFTVNDECGATEEILISISKGLLTIEKKSGIIHLIHYTAQRFFEGQEGLLLAKPHRIISDVAAVYLSHNQLVPTVIKSHSDLEATRSSKPFLHYAYLNFGHHTHRGSDGGTSQLSSVIGELLRTRPTIPLPLTPLGDYIDHGEAIHFAALYGLVSLFNANIDSIDRKSALGCSPLFFSCLGGHTELVKRIRDLSNIGSSVRDATVFGATALHAACRSGSVSVVKLLIPAASAPSRVQRLFGLTTGKLNLDVKMSGGLTALHLASENGYAKIVQELLWYANRPTDGIQEKHRPIWQHRPVLGLRLNPSVIHINAQDNKLQTALSKAAEKGHKEVVQLLLNFPGTDVGTKDWLGDTPLHSSAENGHEEVIELLLSSPDVDANVKNSLGWTPLHRAVISGQDGVLHRFAVHPGVNINTRNDQGWTLLHLAAHNGRLSVVEILLHIPGIDVCAKTLLGWTPLHRAANGGHVKVVRLLLSHADTDVNARSSEGWTPLHLAALNGHASVVQLILQSPGAQPASKSVLGWTPLHRAVKYGHQRVVQLLLECNGVDVNTKSNEGWTPLHLATQNSHTPLIESLLGLPNIDVNAKNLLGWTPLHKAAANGYDEVVQLLLRHSDIDINSGDNEKWTPLHRAAQRGHASVVQLLLNHTDMDVNATTVRLLTPLHMATMNGHKSIFQLLIRLPNIHVSAKDSLGRTPLSFSAHNNDEEMFRTLLNHPLAIEEEWMDSSLLGCTCTDNRIIGLADVNSTERDLKPIALANELPVLLDTLYATVSIVDTINDRKTPSRRIGPICSKCIAGYLQRFKKGSKTIHMTLDDDPDAMESQTLVSEYAEEIIEYMQDLAEEAMPDSNYMELQSEVTWPMRQQLLDWLVQVHLQYRMEPETLWRTVNIIDRFLSRRLVAVAKLQLVGITALFIAAKYEEILSPSVDEYVHMSECAYSKCEILKGELIMLQALDFDISQYCAPYSWIHRICKADDIDLQSRALIRFLLDVTLFDHRFLQMKPSLIAAVATYGARRMLDSPWTDRFIYYSGYTEGYLILGHQMLLEKLNEDGFSSLYVYKKYTHEKFHNVSTLAVKWAKGQVSNKTMT